MSGRFVNRLTLLLLLVCVALSGVISWEWRSAQARTGMPAESMRDATGAPAPRDATLPMSLPSTALQEYQEILDRPLFIKGRRPPEIPAPTTVVAEQTEPLSLVLEGVAISDDKRVALLRNVSSNELLSLAEGSTQDDWTIASVLADRVIVSREGQTQELLLESPPATQPKVRRGPKPRRAKQ